MCVCVCVCVCVYKNGSSFSSGTASVYREVWRQVDAVDAARAGRGDLGVNMRSVISRSRDTRS